MADLDILRTEVRNALGDLSYIAKANHTGQQQVDTVRAELLRLAADNCGMHKALCEHDELCEQLTAMRLRAEKSEAELEALKARMKPCAQVVGGEVRALMDPDDEGKYVAVLVVEE